VPTGDANVNGFLAARNIGEAHQGNVPRLKCGRHSEYGICLIVTTLLTVAQSQSRQRGTVAVFPGPMLQPTGAAK